MGSKESTLRDVSSSKSIEAPQSLMISLRRLMHLSETKLTEAELARQTKIPQPTLHKILSGQTTDPRASTLFALAEFFNVSIDELLGAPPSAQSPLMPQQAFQSLPILSWAEVIQGESFRSQLDPNNWQDWANTDQDIREGYALISKPCLAPRFPKGTILIIDSTLQPEDGDLVVVHYPNTLEATLREIAIDGPLISLVPLCSQLAIEPLTDAIPILGVLSQSKFLYHES